MRISKIFLYQIKVDKVNPYYITDIIVKVLLKLVTPCRRLVGKDRYTDNKSGSTSYTIRQNTSEKARASEKYNNMKIIRKDKLLNNYTYYDKRNNMERKFMLYEIGVPQIICEAYLQLFEKRVTLQGSTLWNEMTDEDAARVSTRNSNWSNEDVSIKFKPLEPLFEDDFSVPIQQLCLILPFKDASDSSENDRLGEFLIVPKEDIITLTDNFDNDTNGNEGLLHSIVRRKYRRVAVRMTSMLMRDRRDLKIFYRGSEKFLEVPHLKSYRSQFDIEARADDNKLVLIGALGRIITIVSDSTHRTRSILTIHATNTGLAASNFSAIVCECIPASLIMDTASCKNSRRNLVLLPPGHTKRFHIDIPLKNRIETAQCCVQMVNEDGDSVAIRDVKIKRDDRCFCVWHCDCVCLSEDPELLCRSLSNAQLLGAGLLQKDTLRRVRSACYPDVVVINLVVIIVGVLLALLLLGVVKACLGLILKCVGLWGLHYILKTPRKLERYYEWSLRKRRVVYDIEGHPVHPDTKQRSVHLVSKFMEFILNMIFFIILPCVIIWNAMRQLFQGCQTTSLVSEMKYKDKLKKCFSSHEGSISPGRRKRRDLRKWMTPQAEELSTKVLHKGLTPDGCTKPLLQEKRFDDQTFIEDSEQDDAEFVAIQMQKSRQSLARNLIMYEESKRGVAICEHIIKGME